MTRVTQGLQRNTLVFNLNRALDDYTEVNKKIAKGKEIYLPSQDPLRYIRALSIKNAMAENEQFKRNADDIKRYLTNSEAAVQDTVEILQRTRVLTLQASNDSLTANDRKLTAHEIDQLIEELVNQANTKFEEGYIFGGARSDAEPFSVARDSNGKITDVYYVGNDRVMDRQIEEGARIGVNFIGSSLYQAAPQTVDGGLLFDDTTSSIASQSGFTTPNPTAGFFTINGTRIAFDTAADSLADLVSRINTDGAASNATASIARQMTGTAGAADPDATLATQLPGVTGGRLIINGGTIEIDPDYHTLNDVAAMIDRLQTDGGARARLTALGPNTTLRLDGIQSISAPNSVNSNILELLGITDASGALQNNATDGYRLRLESDEAEQMVLADEGTGALLKRLEIIDGVGAGPNNIHANAFNDNRSVFAVLIELREALTDEAKLPALRDSVLRGIDQGINTLTQSLASIGARQNRVAQASDRLAGFKEEAARVLSQAEDLDLAEAITNLKLSEVKVSAAAQTGKSIFVPTLLNFL